MKNHPSRLLSERVYDITKDSPLTETELKRLLFFAMEKLMGWSSNKPLTTERTFPMYINRDWYIFFSMKSAVKDGYFEEVPEKHTSSTRHFRLTEKGFIAASLYLL